jgi:hypothetical protein
MSQMFIKEEAESERKIGLDRNQDDSGLGIDILEESIAFTIDDDTDFEEEKDNYKRLDVGLYPKTTTMNISFALQDLGIRLLTSAQVRALYKPAKEQYLQITYNPINKLELTLLLSNVIQQILVQDKVAEGICRSKEFENASTAILTNEDIFFKPKYIDAIADLANKINEVIKDNSLLRENAIDFHLNKAMQSLRGKAGELYTKTYFISKGALAGFQLKLHLAEGNPFERALYKAYDKGFKQYMTEKNLLLKAREFYIHDNGASLINDLILIEDLKDNLQQNRPILKYSTSFEVKDFTAESTDFTAALFTHLRIDHCSQKRYIRNIEQKGKEYKGGKFSRGLSYDSEDPFCVIENQEISIYRVVSSKVKYPYKSSLRQNS